MCTSKGKVCLRANLIFELPYIRNGKRWGNRFKGGNQEFCFALDKYPGGEVRLDPNLELWGEI